MGSTRRRARALVVQQEALEKRLRRLRNEDDSAAEISGHMRRLSIIDDEIAAAMTDPGIAALIAGWG